MISSSERCFSFDCGHWLYNFLQIRKQFLVFKHTIVSSSMKSRLKHSSSTRNFWYWLLLSCVFYLCLKIIHRYHQNFRSSLTFWEIEIQVLSLAQINRLNTFLVQKIKTKIIDNNLMNEFQTTWSKCRLMLKFDSCIFQRNVGHARIKINSYGSVLQNSLWLELLN